MQRIHSIMREDGRRYSMSGMISIDDLLRYANDRISKIKEIRDSAKLNGEGDVFARCNGGLTEARRMKRYFNMFAPVVDAVPVVRCRDCRLWRRVGKYTGKCPFLIGENQFTADDHYCSLAEKIDGGADNA